MTRWALLTLLVMFGCQRETLPDAACMARCGQEWEHRIGGVDAATLARFYTDRWGLRVANPAAFDVAANVDRRCQRECLR